METQTAGVILAVLQVLLSVGDLAVLGTALATAVVCTRRRLGTAAAWVLFAAAALAFGAGLLTRLMYINYSFLYDAIGQEGSFAVELALDGLELVAIVLMGVAILLFRPVRPAQPAVGEVAHG